VPDTQVLIVGAGPTGLALALWLAKLGVGVRVIDQTAEPGTTSRALAVQARTLELYRQLGLDEAVVEHGHRVPAVNLWVRGERVARLPLSELGRGLTPYPFLHIYPQDEHERLLIERLDGFGVQVERRTTLIGFEQQADGVVAQLRGADGARQQVSCTFLCGCDGARSAVREGMGTGFPGGTYKQLFYVADVEASGPPVDGCLHVDLDEADFLAVFPLADTGRIRLIGTVRDERAEHPETLGFEDVSRRAIEHLKLQVGHVNWFSTYHVHHRVTSVFREGRAFLLGDAAHIHSPAGGQGMNTGLGDAINLAWKLQAVLNGRAPDSLLQSYDVERHAFATKLVRTTDRVFSFVTAEGQVADVLRTRLAPLVLPNIVRLEAVRDFMFRTVSQISIDYRGSPLSAGSAGSVQGGDRLPWAPVPNADNFETLRLLSWQVHVYGDAPPVLASWCRDRGLPLRAFEWQAQHEEAGLQRNGLYLLRPDSYVGLAEPQAGVEALQRYFTERGIEPAVAAQ
jgi:2-polyprenyl-6-methoxyphenol hydroxylase-like FAD-dependent oxidoreductase